MSTGEGPRLVLLRHGRSAHNHRRVWQGQADVPLDDVGRLQAKAAAEYLVAERPVAVVASDLLRARDTGQVVAAAAGVPLALDARLREIDVGAWENLTDADIAATGDSEALAAYRRGEEVPAGGSERLSDVGRRGAEALAEHAASLDGGTLVVVAHGVVLRCAALTLLRVPRPLWGMLGGLPNCGWGVLSLGWNGWRMLGWALTVPDPSGVDAPGTGVNAPPGVV